MDYKSTPPAAAIAHISGTRIPWLETYGALASRIKGDIPNMTVGAMNAGATEQFDARRGVLKPNPTAGSQEKVVLDEASQYAKAVIAHSDTREVELHNAAITVVKMHLKSGSAVGNLDANMVLKRDAEPATREVDSNVEAPLTAHIASPPAATAPGTVAAPPPPTVIGLDNMFANDIILSVEASVAALKGAVSKLNDAKNKLAEAAEAKANPPKPTTPRNNAANNNSPGGGGDDKGGDDAGKGDGKGDKGNKDKGQPLQGPTLAQPGSMGDSRALFDAAKNAPITPDVGAVADASKIEQLPFPQFGGLPANGIRIPGISRPETAAVAATSGTPPANAPTNIIPGEFRPAQAIDRGALDRPLGGEGGGGGPERGVSVSTGGTGGVAGGSFEGDIGKGMGPVFGGKAGLNDPVKKYETGPGGGTNNTESTGTINTGADGGIPPALQGQLASGKKMKDGPGRGAMGLMGQVFSLIQTQCTDQTQRNKMEAFCVNATQVSGRAQAKEVAYSNPAAPRRDLASDRGVTSSK